MYHDVSHGVTSGDIITPIQCSVSKLKAVSCDTNVYVRDKGRQTSKIYYQVQINIWQTTYLKGFNVSTKTAT